MLPKSTRAAIAAAKKIDKQIEQSFYRQCIGLKIPIMQITDIYAAGRKAAADGTDIDAAVLAAARALDAGARS